MCKKGERFEGIQGFDEKGNIITGGNFMSHKVLMGVTRKFAREELEKISEGFTRYKFKLQKV